MSRQPAQATPQDGGGGGGGGMMDCCRGCWSAMPAVTRGLLFTALFAGVAGPFLYDRFETCADVIIASKGLELYRILLAPFFGNSFFSAFFVMLMFWQVGSRLELARGSLLVLCWSLGIAWTTYALLFALGAAFNGGGVTSGWFCDSGLWPVVFGLYALDCMFDTAPTRRFMCCPFELNPKYQPLIMLLLMELMMMGSLAMPIGMGLGYAAAYFPALEIRADRVRRWEALAACSCLTARNQFIGIDRAGTLQPWSFGQPPGARDNADGAGAGGSSRSGSGGGSAFRSGPRSQGMGHGHDSGSGDTRPSVFSGTGYKLGSSSGSVSGAGAAAVAPSAPPRSALGGSSGAAAGTKTHRPGTGHVLADRFARAAAVGGAAAGTSTATPSSSSAASKTQTQTRTPSASASASASAQHPRSSASTTTVVGTPSSASGSAAVVGEVGGGELAAAAAVAQAIGGGEPDDIDGGQGEGEGEGGHDDVVVPIAGPVSTVRPDGGSVYIGIASDAGGAAGGAGGNAKQQQGKDKKAKTAKDVEMQPMLAGSGADHDDPQSVGPFEAALRRLTDMGFSHDDALRALNATDGDLDRANELLLSAGK